MDSINIHFIESFEIGKVNTFERTKERPKFYSRSIRLTTKDNKTTEINLFSNNEGELSTIIKEDIKK